MRKVIMTLTGLPATLVAALQSGQIPAKRMLGVKKSNVLDGQYEVVYLSGDATVEKKLEIDIPGMVTTNHVIALRGDDNTVQGHFLIEDAKLDIPDANEIANILIAGAYDETGNVRDAHDGSILMPANVTSDRARIRLSDGQFIDVDTSDFGDNAKLTASLVTTDGGSLLIGAEGDTAIYAKSVSKLLAEAKGGAVQNLGEYIELDDDAKLNRIARAKDDEVTIQTDQGAIKAKVADGKVKFGEKVEVKAPMADDADTVTGGAWDHIGDTDAVVDGGGNRSQAWVQNMVDGGVKLTFLPNKGAPATEAQV